MDQQQQTADFRWHASDRCVFSYGPFELEVHFVAHCDDIQSIIQETDLLRPTANVQQWDHLVIADLKRHVPQGRLKALNVAPRGGEQDVKILWGASGKVVVHGQATDHEESHLMFHKPRKKVLTAEGDRQVADLDPGGHF